MNCCFPGLTTLRRWVRGFQCHPGILTDVKKMMSGFFQAETSPLSKLTILSFDEMEISRSYEYDQESDQVRGSNKKIQAVMARGLCKAWKQLVFYDYDAPMKKDLLFDIIKNVEETGKTFMSL